MRFAWLLLLALPALAQQRGMYGGISTGQIVGAPSDPGFAGRLGATISGLPQTTTSIPINGGIYGNMPIQPGARSFGSHRGNTLVVPYGVPLVYGGYGTLAASYNSGYDYAPRAIAAPVESSPSVIINQYFTPDTAHPQMKEYTNLPEPIRPPQTARPRVAPEQNETQPPPAAAAVVRNPEEAAKPTITLLAFKDSSVVAVIAYWAQDNELHYITKSYKKNVVALSTLDRPVTEQMNAERKIEFTLE